MVPDAKATFDGWTAYVYDPGGVLPSPSLLAESLARNHPRGGKVKSEFIGKVVAIRPNYALLARNGDPLSYSVVVGCGGGSTQGCTVMVDRDGAEEWADRKVRVTVEAVDL